MDAICVDPARIHEIWPHVSKLIRLAMTRMELSEFAVVEKSVLSGDALLWVAQDKTIAAAAVTELSLVDGEKYCTIVACAGEESNRWLHLIERIEEFGQAEGCRAMRIWGRKGWARALPDYDTHALVLQKELT